MMRRARSAAFLVAVLACACGEEDVQLLRVIDGSATKSGTHADAAADGFSDAIPPDAVVDATLICAATPGRLCRENGTSCIIGAECCSSRCVAGVCLEPGSCAGPGVACTSRDACCSGRCEPVVGTTNQTCLNYCLADGAACSIPLDCCSMGCHAGTCGAPICGAEGAPCTTAADCCSEICAASLGVCRSDEANTVCRATGESCDADDNDDGDIEGPRCCGACAVALGRCDFGPGPCLPTGSLCMADTDCCRGSCAADAGGIPVCTAPCLADGTACISGGDCCGDHCNGTSGECGPAMTACNLLGTGCTEDADCCTGQCLGDTCSTSCPTE